MTVSDLCCSLASARPYLSRQIIVFNSGRKAGFEKAADLFVLSVRLAHRMLRPTLFQGSNPFRKSGDIMIKPFIKAAVIFAAGFALCAAISSGNLASLAKEKLSRQNALVTQAPSTAQQWEYRVITGHSLNSISEKDVNAKLSHLTEQGFEVYWLDQVGSGAEFHLTIALRRPKR
jgi:hypothetical protein